MKERPLRCTAFKARWIREGKATETRRRIKIGDVEEVDGIGPWPVGARRKPLACPYGKEGGILWIMEPWLPAPMGEKAGRPYLLASHVPEDDMRHWNAAHTMPRGACETIVRITSVTVQRLLSIDHAAARAEGFDSRLQFCQWWELCYGEADFELNSFVWVLKFEKIAPLCPV